MSSSVQSSGLPFETRALLRALDNAAVGVAHHDLDGVCRYQSPMPRDWPFGSLGADGLPEALAEKLQLARNATLTTGQEQTVTWHYETAEKSLAFVLTISPDRDETGTIDGTLTVLTDCTATRQREKVLESLMREVNHRSNNLLAIVQSIAMQTGRNSGRVDTFLNRFRARLHALASAQDLVTDGLWLGVEFRALATAQLARMGEAAQRSVDIVGDDPRLRPNAALHIGLALHELIDNALSHGLAEDTGTDRIVLGAEVGRDGLVITWNEQIQDPGTPLRPQFGTLVLERIAPLSVGGTADLDISSDRLTYTLNVPADQFD